MEGKEKSFINIQLFAEGEQPAEVPSEVTSTAPEVQPEPTKTKEESAQSQQEEPKDPKNSPDEPMIPKHRLDELSAKNKELEAKLAQYEQKLQEPVEDWEGKYKALLKENQEKETAAAEARRRETIMNSIGAEVHDKALVYDLLKLEAIKVEGDKVEGIAEQIKELKKTKPFLFKPVAQIAKPASQATPIEKSFGKQLAGEVIPNNAKSNYFK